MALKPAEEMLNEALAAWNWGGIVVGAVAANVLPWGIAAINAMIVAAVCFFLGELLGKKHN